MWSRTAGTAGTAGKAGKAGKSCTAPANDIYLESDERCKPLGACALVIRP